MRIGALLGEYLERLCLSASREARNAINNMLKIALCSWQLGGTCRPDGQETKRLFFIWDGIAHVLGLADEHLGNRAVMRLRDVMQRLYRTYQRIDIDLPADCRQAAWEFRAHCLPDTRSHFLMPTWVNLSQGGSTLHSPEATKKKASTTSAGVRGKDPQPVVSGRRAKNLAEILSSYKKTKKPKKRPRAKPAAKEPPRKKPRLLPGESSESEEFEETEEDEEEEPPSGDEEEEPPARDDDDEDETQETQIADRGELPWAWLPLQQEDQWGAWRGVPIWKWRPWRTEIPRDILQQKTKLGYAGTIYWVPADYNSAMWHSAGEYCVAARSYATEEECKNAAAVASATGGVPAPSARKKKVKAKRPKKKRKTATKSGGKEEEEDAGEGDKEDTEKARARFFSSTMLSQSQKDEASNCN